MRIGNAKLVMDCARKGTRPRRRSTAYTDYLGATVCTAVALFDPEIIAGGGVSNDGEFLLAPIRAYAEKYAFFRTMRRSSRRELRNDAGIVGAAMLHLQR